MKNCGLIALTSVGLIMVLVKAEGELHRSPGEPTVADRTGAIQNRR